MVRGQGQQGNGSHTWGVWSPEDLDPSLGEMGNHSGSDEICLTCLKGKGSPAGVAQ